MVASSPSDALLVSAARRGDRSAFAHLHDRYCRMVHAILLARVPPREADDLVQEVFLSALEKVGGLQEVDAFGAWLGTIARNRARDWHRTKKVHDELVEDPGAAPPPVLEAREALDAIRTLPEAYAETLIMRLVEGMTGPEIAERTGLRPDSVRVNLHRGMKLLREKLAKEAS
jgi:RNA polymerase sigma-70 factor (ECF subfamily)